MTAAHTDHPDIVAITGDTLTNLLAEFARQPHPHVLLVWMDEGGAKFKFDRGCWSPPLGHHA